MTFGRKKTALSKLKTHLRRTAERIRDALWDRIGSFIDLFTLTERANFFTAAAYEAD